MQKKEDPGRIGLLVDDENTDKGGSRRDWFPSK